MTDEQIDALWAGETLDRLVHRRFARAVLAAAVPPGCVVVPMEPSVQFLERFEKRGLYSGHTLLNGAVADARKRWHRLLELASTEDIQPTLPCKKCGADRAREPCRNRFIGCPMTGTAAPATP